MFIHRFRFRLMTLQAFILGVAASNEITNGLPRNFSVRDNILKNSLLSEKEISFWLSGVGWTEQDINKSLAGASKRLSS